MRRTVHIKIPMITDGTHPEDYGNLYPYTNLSVNQRGQLSLSLYHPFYDLLAIAVSIAMAIRVWQYLWGELDPLFFQI